MSFGPSLHETNQSLGIGKSVSPPDTRTEEEKQANRTKVAAWFEAWYALSPAQQTRWRSMTPAEMEVSKQMTPAELTASMEEGPVNTSYPRRIKRGAVTELFPAA